MVGCLAGGIPMMVIGNRKIPMEVSPMMGSSRGVSGMGFRFGCGSFGTVPISVLPPPGTRAGAGAGRTTAPKEPHPLGFDRLGVRHRVCRSALGSPILAR